MPDRFFGTLTIPSRFWNMKSVHNLIVHNCKSEYFYEVKNGLVEIGSDRAVEGKFEELEGLLQSVGIPFNRHSEGFAEFDPVTRYVRPDGLDVTILENEEGDTYVPANKIRYYLGLSPEDFRKQVEHLLEEHDPKPQALVTYNDEATYPFSEDVVLSKLSANAS